VAVWDTVGAMGFPEYDKGSAVDAFKFTDTKLSPKVANGFHAVALDEQRATFAPTLWDDAPNVIQVLFPGAHADVGGGYPVLDRQSGLSDGALKWMKERLSEAGVIFEATARYAIDPCAVGTAHTPWGHLPWTMKCFPKGLRTFKGARGLQVHESVAARMAGGPVLGEPGGKAAVYNPANLP
jgi:hypothetical protein